MSGRPIKRNSTAPVDAGSARPHQESGFYDNPAWYDLVHAQGTLDDIRLLERLNRTYGTAGLVGSSLRAAPAATLPPWRDDGTE